MEEYNIDEINNKIEECTSKIKSYEETINNFDKESSPFYNIMIGRELMDAFLRIYYLEKEKKQLMLIRDDMLYGTHKVEILELKKQLEKYQAAYDVVQIRLNRLIIFNRKSTQLYSGVLELKIKELEKNIELLENKDKEIMSTIELKKK